MDTVLPPPLAVHLEEFVEHLDLQGGRSAHTIRAYTTDIRTLLAHLEAGHPDARIDDLTLEVLRSWLAEQVAGGAARTTDRKSVV